MRIIIIALLLLTLYFSTLLATQPYIEPKFEDGQCIISGDDPLIFKIVSTNDIEYNVETLDLNYNVIASHSSIRLEYQSLYETITCPAE